VADVIVADNLTKSYGTRRGVVELTFAVAPGEVFGYLGPNGAGKTTTIRTLLDLLRPTSGRATVLGLDSHHDSVRIRGRVGYLPGEFSLYDRIADEDPFPYSDRLHEDFLAQFRDEDVRRALLTLPEAYRVPLVLLYAEGMTYRELAEVLACPVGTVMSRLHRGRKRLERELWECARQRGLVRTWTSRIE